MVSKYKPSAGPRISHAGGARERHEPLGQKDRWLLVRNELWRGGHHQHNQLFGTVYLDYRQTVFLFMLKHIFIFHIIFQLWLQSDNGCRCYEY